MNINTIPKMNGYAAMELARDGYSGSADMELNMELNQESTQVQNAFQVDITQEALAIQNRNTLDLGPKGQEQILTRPIEQSQQLQGGQSIKIDIIA